jgi:hypothetical protein
MATATATFSTIRNLGSAISVVVGSVIFQNQMMSKQDYLRAELGPIANAFGGGSASASVGIIQSLPDRQRKIARDAFSSSLSTMWITYVAFSALGLFISAFISKNVLEKEHVETRTGMEEERRKRAEREAERGERRGRRRKRRGEASEETAVEDRDRDRDPEREGATELEDLSGKERMSGSRAEATSLSSKRASRNSVRLA